MKKNIWAVAVVLMSAVGVNAEDTAPLGAVATSSVEVLDALVGTGVENREPIGAAESFDATVTRVYCWTRAKASSTPVTLHHVWSRDGEKVSEVPLTLNVSPARTWSYKTVVPGSWKVEVTDESGVVLKTLEFQVSSGAEGLPPAVPAGSPQ